MSKWDGYTPHFKSAREALDYRWSTDHLVALWLLVPLIVGLFVGFGVASISSRSIVSGIAGGVSALFVHLVFRPECIDLNARAAIDTDYHQRNY